MTSLAPTLEAFFTERLLRQRQASSHTVRSYRDTFRLLLVFAHGHTGKAPSQLDLADLDAGLISAFLDHLEHERHNTVRTRNTRMAAIRSLFRFASYREPADAAVIQRVLAIPDKRSRREIVSYLSAAEVDALLAAPDRSTWIGRRDHALLVTAIQTGLRDAELTALRRRDAVLVTGAHVRCHGKGRKDRCVPLTRCTVDVLRTWLAICLGRPVRHSVSVPAWSVRRGHAPASGAGPFDVVQGVCQPFGKARTVIVQLAGLRPAVGIQFPGGVLLPEFVGASSECCGNVLLEQFQAGPRRGILTY